LYFQKTIKRSAPVLFEVLKAKGALKGRQVAQTHRRAFCQYQIVAYQNEMTARTALSDLELGRNGHAQGS
jgi:hypothetical protein